MIECTVLVFEYKERSWMHISHYKHTLSCTSLLGFTINPPPSTGAGPTAKKLLHPLCPVFQPALFFHNTKNTSPWIKPSIHSLCIIR